MINTRLILVEGPPGSGKSTTAEKLAQTLQQAGFPCRYYNEWSPDHPIQIGDDLHVGEVFAASIAREEQTLEQWRRFTRVCLEQPTLIILESRFWQTGVMPMYAAGLSEEGVAASHARVVEIIRPLNPVLIHFTISDLAAFERRTIQIKEEQWQQAGFPGTWAQHVYDAIDSQVWARQRGLSGLEGFVAFLTEWAAIADRLYAGLPFPKIQIQDPHLDWNAATRRIHQFLQLSSAGSAASNGSEAATD